MKCFHIYVDHEKVHLTEPTTEEIWDIMKLAKKTWPNAYIIEVKTMGNGEDSMIWRAPEENTNED